MALRKILQGDNEFLRKKSREVSVFDNRLHTLLDDMAQTMRAAPGVGLAAVQVGVLRRVVTIDVGDGLMELINPEIIWESEEKQSGAEGCLSFSGRCGTVERPMRVKIRAQDRYGELAEYEGEELKARAFCHEIDHLNGVLFVDLVSGELKDTEDGD